MGRRGPQPLPRVPTPASKVCRLCDVEKPAAAFTRDRTKSRDGMSSACQACRYLAKGYVKKGYRKLPRDQAGKVIRPDGWRRPAASKLCRGCSTTKPSSEFHKASARPDGLQDRCKVCIEAYRKARPSNARARSKHQRQQLNDSYIRDLLAVQFNLRSASDVPIEWIIPKRCEILAARARRKNAASSVAHGGRP